MSPPAKSDRSKKWVVLLNGIVSLLLMAGVLYWVGAGDVARLILTLNPVYLAISLMFLLLMYAGMIYRIHLLLEEMTLKVAWRAIARAHWVGMLLADFTPARAGYFAAAAVLSERFKVPPEKALLSVFGPQVFDFALKLVAGSLAVYYILLHFLKPENGTVLFIGTAGMAVIITVMLLTLFSSRFLRLLSFSRSWPVFGMLFRLIGRMQEHAYVVVRKTLAILVLMLLTWSAKSISWYFVAKSIGIRIDLGPYPEILFYYFFQALVTMLEFIPSPTLAGIGLSEGGSTLVMSLFGVSPAAAAAFAVVARFKTVFINLLGIPDAVSLLQKIDIGKLMKSEAEAGVEST